MGQIPRSTERISSLKCIQKPTRSRLSLTHLKNLLDRANANAGSVCAPDPLVIYA